MLSFGDEACLHVPRAGGKGASLARMSALGLPVPPGFVIPAECLAAALPDGGAELRAALPDAARAQQIVAGAEPPAAIADAYAALGATQPASTAGTSTQPASPAGTGDQPVAVRSSACAEDSETASYAGQQETFLHVRGAPAVRDRVRDCWASFFSERAIFYRQRKGSLDDLAMAVVVQRMVQAEVAGVLFTCDPVHRRRDRMVVEAVLGLGEAAVSGQVTPDHYVLKRDGTLKRAHVAQQPFAIVPLPEGGTAERELEPERGGAQKLGEDHLRALARIGDDLEQRLGRPQDIEWALEAGEIYVLQARPVTT
jgi:pyruvate,water dikinase